MESVVCVYVSRYMQYMYVWPTTSTCTVTIAFHIGSPLLPPLHTNIGILGFSPPFVETIDKRFFTSHGLWIVNQA